jgi:hypothetical protein
MSSLIHCWLNNLIWLLYHLFFLFHYNEVNQEFLSFCIDLELQSDIILFLDFNFPYTFFTWKVIAIVSNLFSTMIDLLYTTNFVSCVVFVYFYPISMLNYYGFFLTGPLPFAIASKLLETLIFAIGKIDKPPVHHLLHTNILMSIYFLTLCD